MGKRKGSAGTTDLEGYDGGSPLPGDGGGVAKDEYRIEVFTNEDHDAFAWQCLDRCGWLIADSGAYSDRAACEADAQAFKDRVAAAPIIWGGVNEDVDL